MKSPWIFLALAAAAATAGAQSGDCEASGVPGETAGSHPSTALRET